MSEYSEEGIFPEHTNVVLVDQFTVNRLYHTAHQGFWDEQPDRFELVYTERDFDQDNPPSDGFMLWIEPENNFLNAKIVYNWFVSRFETRGAAILWDLVENPEPGYVVWVGAYGEWMENYQEMTRVE